MTKHAAYAVDDPTVVALGRFLQAAPLVNGTTTSGLGAEVAALLAQAVANWTQGLVWDIDQGQWVDRAVVESHPDLGDVEVEEMAGGQVWKLTQRSTGLKAFAEDPYEAWAELKAKAAQHGR